MILMFTNVLIITTMDKVLQNQTVLEPKYLQPQIVTNGSSYFK